MSTTIKAESNEGTMTANPDLLLQMYQFYEESAQRAKSDAWTQTTWCLALSGAVLGFSADKHAQVPTVVVLGCAVIGVMLAGYAAYVLNDLAKHIQSHWRHASHVVERLPPPWPDILLGTEPVAPAGKPKFVMRLRWPVAVFGLIHVLWAVHVSAVLCR